MVESLTIKGFLVVRASGEMRVLTKARALNIDEVAFPITVTIPKTWGRVQSTRIELTMPEPPEALVKIGEARMAELDALDVDGVDDGD